MRANRWTFSVTILGVLAFASCNEQSSQRQTSPPATNANAPTSEELASVRDLVADQPKPQGTAQGLPAGHPPIEGMTPPGGAPAGEPTAIPLSYQAPEAWQKVAPGSSMRVDQFRLPRAEGDPEDGELAVFYFGPRGGGGVAMNIERWRGQFHGPDGGPVPDEACTREELDINGLKVTYLEIAGEYVSSPMEMGAATPAPRKDFRLLAAIVATDTGPWFFKAVGPEKTMAAHRETFKTFLQSLKPGE